MEGSRREGMFGRGRLTGARRRGSWFATGLLGAAILSLFATPAALGADTVYWSNDSFGSSSKVSFASLNGSGGGDLSTAGATANYPDGVAIDAAAGRIYWANFGADKISFASLNGSGGGDLSTTGATVSHPEGVAIDPAAGRIYWANFSGNKISFASLNGSGGGDLSTTGATVSGPSGVAIDPAAGRIYWANNSAGKISFARLNGSGGGDLSTTGATVNSPDGVAVDSAAGRIYWGDYNSGNSKISFARLDGSGGGDLPTTGATVNGPYGVAIDPPAGRIYWANSIGGKPISYARLDGTGGGGDLSTSGATADSADFPALLKAPSATAASTISGGSRSGSTLNCSPGSWAPDLLPSFLYRAPQRFSYSWSRDGAAVPGAGSSTLTTSAGGSYSCQVTASNQAGSATQSSAAHQVAAIRCVVPKLKGKKLKAAKKALKHAHCRLGKVKKPKKGHKKRRVRHQHPKAGTLLAAGAKIGIKLG